MKMRYLLVAALLASMALVAATLVPDESVEANEKIVTVSFSAETYVCHFPPGRNGDKAKLIHISLYDFPCPEESDPSGDLDDDVCEGYDEEAYWQEIQNHLDDHDGDYVASAGAECEYVEPGDADDDE